jgi:hypothetical protein
LRSSPASGGRMLLAVTASESARARGLGSSKVYTS